MPQPGRSRLPYVAWRRGRRQSPPGASFTRYPAGASSRGPRVACGPTCGGVDAPETPSLVRGKILACSVMTPILFIHQGKSVLNMPLFGRLQEVIDLDIGSSTLKVIQTTAG